MQQGDTSIGSKSSQEDCAIKNAPGQSILNSQVNSGISQCRELGNALTQFVNIHNWITVKREDDVLARVKKDYKDEDTRNRFLVLGHSFIGSPLPSNYSVGEIYESFANFPGFVKSNYTNLSFLSAGAVVHETPPAFLYQTEVKITRDWHNTTTQKYTVVPVNYDGIGPAVELDGILDTVLLDYKTPFFDSVERRCGGNELGGAAFSDLANTLRHVYWFNRDSKMLLSHLGALSSEELDELAEEEEKAVTKVVKKKLEEYDFSGKMTGISKNFMVAAARACDPKRFTTPVDPSLKAPPGSHVPLPLVGDLDCEKIAHPLRDKPMPCSLRELDVAPCHARYNHGLLIA